jgi:hypothetical protein
LVHHDRKNEEEDDVFETWTWTWTWTETWTWTCFWRTGDGPHEPVRIVDTSFLFLFFGTSKSNLMRPKEE